MRWFPLLSLLLWCAPLVQAQDTLGVAQLRARLRSLPADTSRVRGLTQLCDALHDQAPTRALPYGEQAVTLARRLKDRPGLMRALLALASCYANLSDAPHALALQQEAVTLARQLPDPDGLVRGYTAMGAIHHQRDDTTSARRNYQQALLHARDPGVGVQAQLTLYGNLGGLFLYTGRQNEGLNYTRQAMMLARRTGDLAGESMYIGHLGTHYLRIGRYEVAEGLLRKALNLSEQTHNARYETNQLVLLATVQLIRGELTEAEELTRRALRQARRINYLERVLDSYDLLANINVSRQQFEEAYRWKQRFVSLNDSLNNSARLSTLWALQTRYETREKENQIRLLTQKAELQQARNQELLAVVGTLVLGLIVVVGLTWKLRRSQQALALNHAALERANLETRQLAASKDRLYSIVAHDLRGPVTSFMGVTELIDFYLRNGDEEGLRRLPNQVRQSAQHLNGLLDNLLNWAVTQTGDLDFQPRQLALGELIQEKIDMHQSAAQARQISLRATVSDELTVWADANMTRTVLRNLVGNALKFTPTGGSIHIAAALAPDKRMVTISVADTGTGIPEEQIEVLLDPSKRVVPTPKPRARSGTGLGLPLCLAFVRRQGGELTIASTLGKGTTVHFTLPSFGPPPVIAG